MTMRNPRPARASPATRFRAAAAGAMAAGLTLGFGASGANAQQTAVEMVPPALSLVDRDGENIVVNTDWAIKLGKALFWDIQAGSQGMACATCHFNAGADTRLKNQLSPGLLDETIAGGDTEFGATVSNNTINSLGELPSGTPAGPNVELVAADLPLHRLVDEADRNSEIITTTNDRISSSGAFDTAFTQSPGFHHTDPCAVDGPFRLVEPRNTPTQINAVFNHRSFWDGRANNTFNGVGVFGMRDIQNNPQLRLVKANGRNLDLTWVEIANASLASQAVGPPLSALEMSCDARRFPDLGKRLLSASTRPLSGQKVHPGDSVLGSLRDPSGLGLRQRNSYLYMIQQAFSRDWWSARGAFDINAQGQLEQKSGGDGYTQAELNFPLFWGIAVMLYERTLISNQSDFDTVVDNETLTLPPNIPGLGLVGPCGGTADELVVRGCSIFHTVAIPAIGLPAPPPEQGAAGQCTACHTGPETFSLAQFQGDDAIPFSILFGGNGAPNAGFQLDSHDNGFQSVGLRSPFSDRINGGRDPYGNPLSFIRQLQELRDNGTPVSDPELQALLDANNGDVNALLVTPKIGDATTAKVPTIRNVALTPPYFSWGGYPSLRNVVRFYNRGGNRRDFSPSNPDPVTGCTAGDESGNGLLGTGDVGTLAGQNCGSNTSILVQAPMGMCDAEFTSGPEADSLGVNSARCVALAAQLGAPVTAENDDLAAVVAFMKTLTDRRVQCDQAPFDHPSLPIPNGHGTTDSDGDGTFDDIVFELPEVGAAGYDPSSGFCIPNAGNLFAPGMQARIGGTPSSPGDL